MARFETNDVEGFIEQVWEGMEEAMGPGSLAILRERQRQKTEEGWSAEHDDGHVRGELTLAAIAYALEAAHQEVTGAVTAGGPHPGAFWPWKIGEWKPSDDAVVNLERAGALIAAEIDRLTRMDESAEVGT